jgi:hypothetical protein
MEPGLLYGMQWTGDKADRVPHVESAATGGFHEIVGTGVWS